MLTYNTLKDLYLERGYKFREQEMALNLGAIRNRESKSNKFDDLGFIAWVEKNQPNLLTFAITTDPGKHYLLTPLNKNGTIIVVPNQYIEVYGRGLHNGKYECFKQRKEMCYVRDNNRETILDFDLYRDPEKRKIYTFWGLNGTNCHRAHPIKIVEWIGPYSAGCQVVQKPSIFKELILLRDRSVFHGFKLWDYTLFEEDEYITMRLAKTEKSFHLITNNTFKQTN